MQRTEKLNFTAIDFETANYQRNSACQLGVVVVEAGEIVDRRVWLLRPPSRQFVFTYLHGITYAQVAQQPTFAELWPDIAPYLEGRLLAAHNAGFDMGVLGELFRYFAIPAQGFRVIDSLKVARKAWPQLPNHRLSTVAEHLDLSLQHHEALSDAVACAGIICAAVRLDGGLLAQGIKLYGG